MMKAWLLLAAAIASEVVATSSLKLSDGFSNLVPSILVVVFYVTAFLLLALVLEFMSVGVVYAIWAGTGTALVAIASSLFLGEEIAWPAWIGIGLIVVGVVLVETFAGAEESGSDADGTRTEHAHDEAAAGRLDDMPARTEGA